MARGVHVRSTAVRSAGDIREKPTGLKEYVLSTFANPLTEFSPQMEFATGTVPKPEDEAANGVFDESQELELAARLLDVANDRQLDQFLRDLIRQGDSAAGNLSTPAQLHAVGNVLKRAIYNILPMRSMEHGATSHSSIGAQLGNGLSSVAGQVLGLELEGLSPEDREFEATRQFVRFAGETVKNSRQAFMNTTSQEAAHRAAAEAAQTYAPGLFAAEPHVANDRGHWILCRDKIILFGV